MFTARELVQVMGMMKRCGITLLEMKAGKESIVLHTEQKVVTRLLPHQAGAFETLPVQAEAAAPKPGREHRIISPMVGSFYPAPSPEAKPFVSVGDMVSPGTIVCIIEAMKIFNEIKAECSGKVVQICQKNGASVDYGKPLFIIELDPDPAPP